MAKFLLVYHGGANADTEEGRNQAMAAWGEWFQQLGGALKDPGNPVGETRTVSAGGAVANGGGTNPATGYSLIEVDSFDNAVNAAKMCPVLSGGGSVEIAETLDIM